MNNKGFAVSGIIYGLLVLFIVLLIALLSMFSSRKKVLDQLKDKVLNQASSDTNIRDFNYKRTNALREYKTSFKGYYELELNSSNATLKTTVYLPASERLYLYISDDKTQIYRDNKKENLVLEVNQNNYYTSDNINGRLFMEPNYIQNTSNTPMIKIKYLKRSKKNKNLNQVRYIKDCILGKDNVSEWSEIKAIVNGENVALNKSVKIYDSNNNELESNNYIVDGDLSTKSTTGTCVIIDLERTYNIDYLYSYHGDLANVYDYNLSVSTANIEYKTIYNYENNNIFISSFDEPKTKLIGNIYVPIKEYDNQKWMRIYHFNNMSGTIKWDAENQVLSLNGYDSTHKKSILYYLNKLNEYEFLMEYPELDNSKVIRWTQTSNFIKEYEVSGFKKIKNDFNTEFGGLKRVNSSNAIITTTDGIHCEIGTLRKKNEIYGPTDELINGPVDLWIKI